MLLASLTAQASPLSAQQVQDLQALVSQLNPIQQAWVSGYLAATAQFAGQGAASVAATQVAEASTLTILYASQTGNAKAVAGKLKAAAESKGFAVAFSDIASYKTNALVKEKLLIIVASTYGEGEPPESAVSFHKFLFGKKAPQLPQLHFAVLGLGDSSYEYFCQTAVDFDTKLATLGAKRLHPAALLDVDYDAQASEWQQQALTQFEPLLKAANSAPSPPGPAGRAGPVPAGRGHGAWRS